MKRWAWVLLVVVVIAAFLVGQFLPSFFPRQSPRGNAQLRAQREAERAQAQQDFENCLDEYECLRKTLPDASPSNRNYLEAALPKLFQECENLRQRASKAGSP